MITLYLSLRTLRGFSAFFAVSAFLPQRTRRRRKEYKDLYAIHIKFLHPDSHLIFLKGKSLIFYI